MGEMEALLKRRAFLEENISKMQYEIEKINKRMMFLKQSSAMASPADKETANTKI